MPMRGLLKRDDPKLQASVSSKYQVLLGRRAAAWRRMPQELRRRWGSCRCACMCAMSLYLDVYCPVEPQQTPRRSFVGGMLHSSPLLSQPRASSDAPACILLMLPQASARAAELGLYRRVVK